MLLLLNRVVTQLYLLIFFMLHYSILKNKKILLILQDPQPCVVTSYGMVHHYSMKTPYFQGSHILFRKPFINMAISENKEKVGSLFVKNIQKKLRIYQNVYFLFATWSFVMTACIDFYQVGDSKGHSNTYPSFVYKNYYDRSLCIL